MAAVWKTRWEEIRLLGEGGQGRVLLVRRRDGADSSERVITARQPMTLADGDGRKPHQRPDVQERLATIEDRHLVPLTRLFDRAFEPRVSDRVQSVQELRALLGAIRDGVAVRASSPGTNATVESLWTLHMVAGEPDALYFHHRLVGASSLESFFEGNRAPAPIASLPENVTTAAQVLWREVVSRAEVRCHLPRERPFHRAFDHVNHILDDGWAVVTTHVRWSRELEVPNGRVSGPCADVGIASLSAGAGAAVRALDAAARTAAASALREALAKKAAW